MVFVHSKKDKVNSRRDYSIATVVFYTIFFRLLLDCVYETLSDQVIEFPLTWIKDYTPKKGPCAPRQGVVIVSMLDNLEYNLLQIGLGRQLADELCWEFHLRPHWKVEFGSMERGCFAKVWNSQTNLNGTFHNMKQDIRSALTYEPNPWNYMSPEWSNANILIQNWAKTLSDKSEIWNCVHPDCTISSSSIANTLQEIRKQQSVTNAIFLEAFFVQYEWVYHWRPSLRQWLTIEPSCCSLAPPTENTVVIHVYSNDSLKARDKRIAYLDIHAAEYRRWLEKYQFNDRPLWIVCDVESKQSSTVRTLLQYYPQAKVVNPENRVDTVCVLSQSKILLVTNNDMLSSVAASMTHPSSTVHYFTHPVGKFTLTTLALPDWKYHVVENDIITNWDVPHSKFQFP
jgi:hypothetical protein